MSDADECRGCGAYKWTPCSPECPVDLRSKLEIALAALQRISGLGGVCTDDADKGESCPICITDEALEKLNAAGVNDPPKGGVRYEEIPE